MDFAVGATLDEWGVSLKALLYDGHVSNLTSDIYRKKGSKSSKRRNRVQSPLAINPQSLDIRFRI